MMKVIEIDNITKKYNGRVAVNNFSLAAESGKIYGFLGPNGAGKTTTIRMIMGIIAPDSGTIKVFGEKLSEESKKELDIYLRKEGFIKI